MNKKILLITYYWPPDNSSGVQRWAYFAHYLQKEGYEIDVVCVDPQKASYKNTDESFITLVKDVNKRTTNTFELLKAYSFLTTGHANKGIPRGSVDDSGSIPKKVANYIKANFFIPDARVGWNRFALAEAKNIVSDNSIVITTGPPQSTHLVGLKLKRLHPKIKWVADFRDPWLELYSNQNQPQSRWAAKKNATLEMDVLTTADAITTIGPSLASLLKNKISKKDKVHYFYNGYDAKKMDSIVPDKENGFNLTFIGLMASDYNSTGLQKALTILSSDFNEKITLKLAGNIDVHFLDEVKKNKNIIVDFEGFVSHNRSLQLMKSASVLFTILPSQPQDQIIISGKMMEYLAAKKPILCIGNTEGDAASLIKESNAGIAVEHSDIEGMVQFIKDCITKKFHLTNELNIEKYSRESVSKKLASFLEQY